MDIDAQVQAMQSLLAGRTDAFGTGRGEWIKRPLRHEDWVQHLKGHGYGIGIAPLMPDSTVNFCAIDLDEPDIKSAFEMALGLPGPAWVERSRSGNAHVWAFFSYPIEAWVARGVLREATESIGKPRAEVFPKNHDAEKVTYGNYINAFLHGDERPLLGYDRTPLPRGEFFAMALAQKNDPGRWYAYADRFDIKSPAAQGEGLQHGTAPELHMCAEWIMANAEEEPIREGHRNGVFFALAKMLSHCALYDTEEAWSEVQRVNDYSPDPLPGRELRRIFGNAERGGYTSYGCDDPLVAPFAHPNCPIANPTRKGGITL